MAVNLSVLFDVLRGMFLYKTELVVTFMILFYFVCGFDVRMWKSMLNVGRGGQVLGR